jgi:hypothetical protein
MQCCLETDILGIPPNILAALALAKAACTIDNVLEIKPIYLIWKLLYEKTFFNGHYYENKSIT